RRPTRSGRRRPEGTCGDRRGPLAYKTGSHRPRPRPLFRMLAHHARRLHSALSVPRYYVGGLFKRLFSNPVPVWCQAISFKVITTLLPLILLAVGVFGLVLRQPDPFETVAGYLRTFLPPAQSGQLISMVGELQAASG